MGYFSPIMNFLLTNISDPSAIDNKRKLTPSFAPVKITFSIIVTQASFLNFQQVLF